MRRQIKYLRVATKPPSAYGLLAVNKGKKYPYSSVRQDARNKRKCK